MLASLRQLSRIWILVFGLMLGVGIASLGYADETEKRRVDISLSIFPRVIAVDNNFPEKVTDDEKVLLLFIYDRDKKTAEELTQRMEGDNSNIGGMGLSVGVMQAGELSRHKQDTPTALFLAERLERGQFTEVMKYAEKNNRLVFSPFSGDVERGASVGISVTNRVKPFFNLPVLKRSGIVIHPLLIKMSKRYE